MCGRAVVVCAPTLALLVTACVLVSAVPAAAAAGSGAVCTFETHEVASPGWWLTTPTHGQGGSRAGTISCTGTVEGRRVGAAPGTIRYRYAYGADQAAMPGGDTCALAAGHGSWEVTLPATDGGSITLAGPIAFVGLGGAGGELHARLDSADVEGIFQARPEPDHLDEDCVSKPFSHFITTAQVTLR